MTARMRRNHLSMSEGPRPRREQITDQDRRAAKAEMRGIGEKTRRERQGEDAVDQDAEVEIAAAGEQAEHAVGKVEHAEQLKKQFRSAARGHGSRSRPQRRDEMQPVGV